jgi:8-oxo-dGTP diphosphatase
MDQNELKANYPKVGIGVMIFKDGKILLAKRKGSHGAGEWSVPGGHLEYMESIEECARREVVEEVGITIKNVRFLCLLNLKDYAPKHYVGIELIADWESGEPRIIERDKIEGAWEWRDLDNLPSPLFKGIPSAIEAHKGGNNFFDN